MRARSRRLIVLLVAAGATLVACGTATTVTPAAPTPATPVLAPGAYTLSVAPDTTTNGQFSTWSCLTVGYAPTSAAVAITLSAADGGYAGRAVNGSLSVSFNLSGAAVTGVAHLSRVDDQRRKN